MWRRVVSLSPFRASSKSTSLCQVQAANGLSLWRGHTTEIEGGGAAIKENDSFITFVLGGPGSGKGTQCARLAETFGFKHLSAGALLRDVILSNSEEGLMIRQTIIEGKIVPSEVTVRVIKKEMESSDNHKFLIDGFPRTEENRIAFEHIFGCEPNMVIYFECPEGEMVERVLHRDEGRDDDNIDTIKKRLEIFKSLSLPVIDHYSRRGKLHKISALGTVDEIFERVCSLFAELKDKNL